MTLGEKIIKLRKSQGWSQEELAARLDISRQAVSKWESMASTPDLDKILKMSQLFGVSTDYLLKEDAPQEEGFADLSPRAEETIPTMTLEEANAYLDLAQAAHRKIALGVSLCILCPVPLLFLSGSAEFGFLPLGEDPAAALGIIALFCIVALGVAFLVPSGIKLEKYEYLEKEPLETQYGVAGMVEKKKEEFEDRYHSGLVIGILLCILSVVPLFGAAALERDFAAVCALCLMFFMISLGCYFIVLVASRWGCYQRLLEEGDYTREKKAEAKQNSPFTVFYWSVTTAIYLAVSFYLGSWDTTWVIWPVAAVLFVAALALKTMIGKKQ